MVYLYIILVSVMIIVQPALSKKYGCDSSGITEYMESVMIDNRCLDAIEKVSNKPENITEFEILSALDVFCTAECGEVLITYLKLNCDQNDIANKFYLACLPTEGILGPTCYFTFPSELNTVPYNLMQCMSFNSSLEICPVGCAEALQNFTLLVGCCYQNVYNNSGEENWNAMFEVLSDNRLWYICNVALIEGCLDIPLPGTSPLEEGICTANKLQVFYEGLSAVCRSSLQLVSDPATETTAEGRNAYSQLCTENCGGTIVQFQKDVCHAKFESLINKIRCFETDGNLGDRCSFSLKSPVAQFIITQGDSCTAFDIETRMCPAGCANALNNINEQLGCCYQSIYNNSVLPMILEEMNVMLPMNILDFLKMLNNPIVWEGCSVPILNPCQGDPFSKGSNGSIQFAASSAMLMVVLLVAAVLY